MSFFDELCSMAVAGGTLGAVTTFAGVIVPAALSSGDYTLMIGIGGAGLVWVVMYLIWRVVYGKEEADEHIARRMPKR